MKCLFLTASIFTILSVVAQARDVPILSQPGSPMRDGESYYISYSCNVTSDLPAYIRRQSDGVLGFNSISGATEVFAIAGASAKVDGAAFDAGGAIDPKVIFSVSSSRGSFVTNDPETCNGSLIAKGSDSPKLAYFLKFTRKQLPDAVSTVLATIQSMIAPVYKIVKGDELANKDADRLTQIASITTAYNDYLALFTDPESTSKAVPLKVGKNILTTKAAKVVVDVRKVDEGYLLAKGIPFVDRYDKLVTITPTFTANNLAISCKFVRKALSTAGFTNPDDQAYIIYRSLNADVIKSRDDFVNCLGNDLVLSVVKNRKLYLKNIPDDLLVSQMDVDRIKQEAVALDVDKTVRSIVFSLATIAGSSKAGEIVPETAKGFNKVAADNIEANDNTGDQVLSPTDATADSIQTRTEGTASEQFNKIVGAGFTKFGCFSLTRSEKILDGDLDGATAVMLTTRPATAQQPGRTVVLRLFIDGKKLVRFDVTDNWLSEAKTAFAKDGRTCSI